MFTNKLNKKITFQIIITNNNIMKVNTQNISKYNYINSREIEA